MHTTSLSSPDKPPSPQALRTRPSPGYASLWRRAGKSWHRDLKALGLLGTTGWSSRLALNKWLVAADPALQSEQDSVIKRLWVRMAQRELVEQRTIVIDRHNNTSVALVWLSERGRHFLHEQGLPFITLSEWDRLRLLHNGERQPVHSAMIILAAYLFRRRGHFTEVCPPTDAPFAPDLLLTDARSRKRVYVEVEAPARGGRGQRERLRTKWRNMMAAQGFVAVCALNPRQLTYKLRSAQQVADRGLGIDLNTLSWDEMDRLLWTESWGDFSTDDPQLAEGFRQG